MPNLEQECRIPFVNMHIFFKEREFGPFSWSWFFYGLPSCVIYLLVITIFFRLGTHAQISAQGLFFTVRGWMTSTNVTKKLVKLPPRRSKKSKITYLSSCCVCKPALNSAISAVSSCSRCSYSPHGRTIDQLRDCSCKRLKLTEQRERKGAITTNALRSAIIEVCG